MAEKGRPREYNREEIAEKLNAYIESTDIPVVAEFCYLNHIRRERLYEIAKTDEELSYTLKRCIDKKEAQLEIKSLKGEINPSQAIFSLKQLGWRDKQELEHSGNMTTTNVDLSKLSEQELRNLAKIK